MKEIIGNSLLINGDCLEEMKSIPDKSIDMVLTDPPYGITKCKWDAVVPFDKMWEQLSRITKDNAPIVLFGSEPFSSLLRASNIKEFKYDWIWEKSKAANIFQSHYAPLKCHEIISVFGRSPITYIKSGTNLSYYPQMTKGAPYNKGVEKRNNIDVFCQNPSSKKEITGFEIVNDNGDRYPRSIQYFVTAESEGKFHPTQKPVALLEYLIRTYTNENDVVLDFTMGSGSTGVAAKNLNRKFIGIELEEKYYQIAKERINKG